MSHVAFYWVAWNCVELCQLLSNALLQYWWSSMTLLRWAEWKAKSWLSVPTTWLDLKTTHDRLNQKLARVQAGWPKYLSCRMPIFSKSQMNREAGSRGLPHRPIGTLANFGASCKYDTWGCLNPATFHQTTSKQCRTTGILQKKKLYKREFSWICACLLYTSPSPRD